MRVILRLDTTQTYGILSIIETTHGFDVTSLDAEHRRALEDLIGTSLQRSQRLVISVTDVERTPTTAPVREAQSISDWTHVYDGLTEEEVEAIDEQIRTRADLTRRLP